MIRRMLLWMTLALACAGTAAACGKTQEKTLCTPGENIFCRCRGGAAGTKACAADGQSFAACIGDTGDCNEIDPTTSSSSSSTSSTSSGGGSGGGSMGGKGYLEPCAMNEECASGICPMGYCTKECASFKECAMDPVFGECIRFDTQMGPVQWCTPYCVTQSDCMAFGMPSECGWAPTLDGMAFPVCADWGATIPLPPDGTDCKMDIDCNLGAKGGELVCAFAKCTAGCYVPDDCPKGKTCSSMGALGTCQ